MTKFGQVVAYNEQTGMATITYARPDACEKCGACGPASHHGSITLKARCANGSWVRVELPEGRFLQAAAMAYVLPLTGLMLGLGLGYFLGGQADGWTVTGGALGLGISLLLLRLNERRIAGRTEWKPRVTQVYAEKPSMDDIGCGGMGTLSKG